MTMQNTKELMHQKIRGKLDETNAEIDRLKAKASQVDADTRLKNQDKIEKLEAARDVTLEKLEQLGNASAETVENLSDQVDQAWHRLRDTLSEAGSTRH